jgi:hypothetical protein
LQKQLKTQPKTMGHNPRVDLCPKSIKKMKKKLRDFGEIGFREKWGESGENGVFGGRRWVEMAGRGAVGGWEVMGGGGAWWVWILGSDWEEKMEKRGGEVYGRYREMRGMGKN